jgi:thiol:disulfide interchange protein DsbD
VAVKLGYTNIHREPMGYPEWHARKLPVTVTPAALSEITPEKEYPGVATGWALVWTLLGIFAGGMALNLTPCVYPLIPITISYFGGRSTKGRPIAHGLCFMSGLALTNSILGVVAAMTGGLMGAILQNPIVLLLIAALLVLLATSLFGFWDLRLPGGLMQAASKFYTGYLGSLFMGLTLGIVAAPCIGPFILGLLTWVASIGSPVFGFLVFFTLSLGLGLPLFFLGLFSGFLKKLPRAGEWMLWVRALMGWVMMGMAVYFIKPILSETAHVFLLAFVFLGAGVHLGWSGRSISRLRYFEWIQTGTIVISMIAVTVCVGSWAMQGPGVVWQPYTEEFLSEAIHSKRPIIIDFSADWCSPCRDLEEITFHDTEVVEQTRQNFIMIKVDLTRKGIAAHDSLLKEYQVKGVPTVLLLDREGRERRDLRVVDFLPADKFLIRMVEVAKLPFSSKG